ncbi:MAG: DNA-binding protein [Xanthobacteraceae bacterium]|nr:DNA-binding protein [Xanthobacteraceae bacterium]
MSRTAHTIDQLIEEGTLNRTAIFKAISDGKLVARKLGRRTIVLDDDYKTFLKNLPLAGNVAPDEAA